MVIEQLRAWFEPHAKAAPSVSYGAARYLRKPRRHFTFIVDKHLKKSNSVSR
jgi:hypothetical protein